MIDFGLLEPIKSDKNNSNLGSGAYAQVKLVKHCKTKQMYALKEVINFI